MVIFQVLSRLGRVIGAREVKVGNNKVSIERLRVDVITGLELDIHTEAALPGSLVAHLTRKEKLTRKYQVRNVVFEPNSFFEPTFPFFCSQ